MPRRNLIRSSAFADPSDLSPEDLFSLSVESTDDFARVLLPDVNWNGGAVGCLSASLSVDNERVENTTFHLLGELWADKIFNVSSFWPTTTATSLTLSLGNLTVFSFPEGSLVSNYVCSSELNFSFTQGTTTISEDDFEAANISEFCLQISRNQTHRRGDPSGSYTNPLSNTKVLGFPSSLCNLSGLGLVRSSWSSSGIQAQVCSVRTSALGLSSRSKS